MSKSKPLSLKESLEMLGAKVVSSKVGLFGAIALFRHRKRIRDSEEDQNISNDEDSET